MKKWSKAVVFLAFGVVAVLSLIAISIMQAQQSPEHANSPTLVGSTVASPAATTDAAAPSPNMTTAQEVVAENIEIPWEIAWLPDGRMLVTERPGRLLIFSDDAIAARDVAGVVHQGEGGLLGMALHPNFSQNQLLYLYQTTESNAGLVNRVMQYQFDDNQLTNPTVILGNIPGAQYHDGGRIAFGPDGFLYITTGDAGVTELAQDTNSLAGKILRVTSDGAPAPGNPFSNEVYSYGHRNPQGLAWDSDGQLWATEHGRSGVLSGFDEVNKIEVGGNYGWPDSQGDTVQAGTIAPHIHSEASVTWAPAGAAVNNNQLIFVGLRGAAIYSVPLGDSAPSVTKLEVGEYGRLRVIRQGPDGFYYLTTSNTDGRGDLQPGDDKIIRLSPAVLGQ